MSHSSRHRQGTTRGIRGGVRAVAIAAAMTLLTALAAGTAWAHVTVDPGTAASGQFATLTFRVPTESPTASTVKVSVALPTDTPIPIVSARQMPGWTIDVEKQSFDPPVEQGGFTLTEAVSQVTWTADDGVGIGPDRFAEFALSLGPVPDVATLTFPATQYYSDGSIVKWDDTATDGAAEPKHPTPTVTVFAAADAQVPFTTESGITVDTPDNTARILSIVAVVLAALAFLTMVVLLRRSRRQT